jgi:hypothetical protein
VDFIYWDSLALQQSGKGAVVIFPNNGEEIDGKRGNATNERKKFY